MIEPLQSILNALPSLTSDELEQVIRAAKAAKSVAIGAASPTALVIDGEQDFLLAVVAGVMQEEVGDFPAMPMLRNAARSVAFQQKLPGLLRYVRSQSDELRMQRAILRLGFQLLYQRIRKAGCLPSPKAMLNNAHKLPAILDQAFPRYAEARLLHMVIDRSAA